MLQDANADPVIAEPHPSRGFEVPEYTVVHPDGYFVTVSAG
jgi:hypothetical protein